MDLTGHACVPRASSAEKHAVGEGRPIFVLSWKTVRRTVVPSLATD